ncbi:hypothetical protein BCEN4_740110 [Burkholderia cenocepacia]|nr:hypothetical protein BCEN4_740110 [Burkholderia cenocepacia]
MSIRSATTLTENSATSQNSSLVSSHPLTRTKATPARANKPTINKIATKILVNMTLSPYSCFHQCL